MKKENKIWENWSGSLKFTPAKILEPESEDEICEVVRKAGLTNKKIRVVGAGHSSTPLVKTDDILISLKHFKGVENPNNDNHTATALAGMTVKEAGADLHRYGLAMHNTGDVDIQTLAGAIGTGTHGTGTGLENLSSMLTGVRMVTGSGEIAEFTQKDDSDLFKALKVGLGTCGIFLKMQLKLQPSYTLSRKEWCVALEKCLENLEDLMKNRNFDFYWYPRSDLAKIRVMNQNEDEMPDIPWGTLEMKKNGNSHEILPRSRHLKFDEIEYALPIEKGPECFLEVRKKILQTYRKEVGWRLLYRTIKGDDAYISSMNNRDSATISLHHNAGLPFWEYFKTIEPIFLKHGGRPHWGKKHTLKAKDLQGLYPEWNKFHHYRSKLDPEGVFITPYMNELLIK